MLDGGTGRRVVLSEQDVSRYQSDLIDSPDLDVPFEEAPFQGFVSGRKLCCLPLDVVKR